MITYNENYKNLYKDMIRKGCLIVIDKYQDEFRGTGKTTALKELQQEGYFVLGDRDKGFDDIVSLKEKIKNFKKSIDIETIKVLVDEDYRDYKSPTRIFFNEIKLEIIGGFIHAKDYTIDIPLVSIGSNIIDTRKNNKSCVSKNDINREFEGRLNIIKLKGMVSEENLEKLMMDAEEFRKAYFILTKMIDILK